MKNIDPEVEQHFLFEMHNRIDYYEETRVFRYWHFDTLIIDSF